MDITHLSRYRTQHWGEQVGGTNINWDDIDNQVGSYLHEVGFVGVDSGCIEAIIQLGDLYTEFRVQTPRGNGCYAVLAGKIEGIGKCLVVAFDLDEEDEEKESWSHLVSK